MSKFGYKKVKPYICIVIKTKLIINRLKLTNMATQVILNVTREDLYDALATFNADPFLVESYEYADNVYNALERANFAAKKYTAEDDEEFDVLCSQLDLTADNKPQAIYVAGQGGNEVTICLANDWQYAE